MSETLKAPKELPTTTDYTWIDKLPPLVLLAIAVGFEVMAHEFPPASGQVPIMIGWTMIVLTVIDLATRFNNQMGYKLTRWLSPAALTEKAERAEKGDVEPDKRRQIAAIAGITIFSVALVYFGVVYPVPVFAIIAIRLGGRFSWLTSIVSAVVITGVIWVLFSFLLRLQLFPGVLFGGS
jgi:hypothetical protein